MKRPTKTDPKKPTAKKPTVKKSPAKAKKVLGRATEEG